MKKIRFGVVIFPGSNCDRDCIKALKLMEIDSFPIWHNSDIPDGIDALIIPGGFSYGDYLRPGVIAKFSKVMDSIKTFGEKGGIILGICNGFQILTEAKLLPGVLVRNKNLRFVCKYVTLGCERNDTAFTLKAKKILKLPIAHGQGRFYAEHSVIETLEKNRQIIFRYLPQDEHDEEYNPNGSLNDIAGIINERGNILGLMPHPERAIGDLYGSRDGISIFSSIITYLEKNV